jgi:hypothetical protein
VPKCDWFFLYRPRYVEGGRYPCCLEAGHDGPHVHFDEVHLPLRDFKGRSPWHTQEEIESWPEYQAYREKIREIRRSWGWPDDQIDV